MSPSDASHEMRQINLDPDNVRSNISRFISEIGKDWTDNEIRRIRPLIQKKGLVDVERIQKKHPLGFLIHSGNDFLTRLSEGIVPPRYEEYLRIACLSHCVISLIDAGTQGILDRLETLKKHNDALFEKAEYEIQVGYWYAVSNHSIGFLQPSSENSRRTPDILVDGMVEVECKRKDSFSGSDLAIMRSFVAVIRGCTRTMEKTGRNYAVILENDTGMDTVNVGAVLDLSRKVIEEGRSGVFSINKRGLRLRLELLSNGDEPLADDKIEFPVCGNPDYGQMTVSHRPGSDDQPVFYKPRCFAIKDPKVRERIDSIINSIEDARTQLSGKRPGIIYIDLNRTDRQFSSGNYTTLESRIVERLHKSSRISAIVLTKDVLSRRLGKFTIGYKSRVIMNTTPSHALPDGYFPLGT